MRFTDEVNWSPADFVVAGALLYGAGLAYELVARRGGNTAYRVAVGVAVGAVLLLLWVNGAVGLIGSEDNPANLLYGAVILVGLIGAVTARFHPRGMARTLFATAVVQALVPVIALPIWKPSVDSAEAFWAVVRVLEVNALFVLLFILSAVLFRNAVFTPPRAAADSN